MGGIPHAARGVSHAQRPAGPGAAPRVDIYHKSVGAPGQAARFTAPRSIPRVAQCFASICFGFGGAGTFAYWNAGVDFNASLVAPGR
jgi:hypothetical protein